MRAVLQRVSSAQIAIEGKEIANCKQGLLVFLGVEQEDNAKDIEYIVDKILHLRIFEDEEEKMNNSITDIEGDILLISQFTLCGDARKGRRPSFVKAMHPSQAEALYETVRTKLNEHGLRIQTGKFGADMQVSLVNDGPVTILLDSKKLF